jgi:hypothetical protein
VSFEARRIAAAASIGASWPGLKRALPEYRRPIPRVACSDAGGLRYFAGVPGLHGL